MFEMGSYGSFGYLKHKLWAKEISKVKLSIWFLTFKPGNHPNFLVFKWNATYRWQGINFALDFTSIESLHTNLWACKITGIPILGIYRLSLGSPGTKWHLDVGPVTRDKEYFKGEGGGFSQVRAMMSLVSPCFPMAYLAPKMFQLCTNQLVVCLCTSVWVIESFVNLLNPHPGAPTCPSTPEMLQAKKRTLTFSPSIVLTFGLTVSPSRCLRVCHLNV
jgi:hypothetical protein